jgi:hypothetical protein
MTDDKAVSVFVSFSSEEKKEFLAQLMYELTLIVRDSYETGRDGLCNPQRVRRANEVQHRVSAFLWAALRDDPQRYPDDVLVRLILEQPDDEVLGRQLKEAFERLAAQRLTPA